MKLVIAIISNKDCDKVMAAIAEKKYFVTKISSKGQFLVDGNTTLMICCTDDRVEELYDVIKNNVTCRIIRTPGVTSTVDGSLLKQAVDVEEYGAVAFSVNIEDFQKF